MEEKLSLLDPSKAQGDRPRATYNTGAKGVLADRNAAASAARQARRATVAEQNDRLERATLNTQTWDHEERQRAAEAAEAAPRRRSASSDGRISPSMDEEGSQEQEDMEYIMARDARRAQRLAELRGGPAASEDESCLETVEFGHLREIDPLTYADVIDNTPPDVNVIIHLYSRRAPLCRHLSSVLASLARQYRHERFLQVSAARVGFGVTSNSGLLHDSGDGAGEDEEGDQHEDFDIRMSTAEEESSDVTPTLLVYRAGELIHNLVRVDLEPDWKQGTEADVRGLLTSRKIVTVRWKEV